MRRVHYGEMGKAPTTITYKGWYAIKQKPTNQTNKPINHTCGLPAHLKTVTVVHFLAQLLECSLKVRETGVLSQVESYQRLKKIVLDAYLVNIQHYIVQIKSKWSTPGKIVSPSSTIRCSHYWKGSLQISLGQLI